MELTIKNLETGIEISVPKGCTANVDGEKVVIKQEKKPKFKKGDCIAFLDGCAEVLDNNNMDGSFPDCYRVGHWITADGVVRESTDANLDLGDAIEKCFKISTKEYQAKFNKFGYEYDFETHTAKPIEWKPKKGDDMYSISISRACVVGYKVISNNITPNLMDFRTRELAESALKLLKNAKHF